MLVQYDKYGKPKISNYEGAKPGEITISYNSLFGWLGVEKQPEKEDQIRKFSIGHY